MKKLTKDFFLQENIFEISKELLGKIIVTKFDDIITSGRIVELEAYNGIVDGASHAYKGKRTMRNEVMYAEAGTAYVYICYGIHHLFNIITNKKDTPHAILIRSVEPMDGKKEMMKRRGVLKDEYSLTKGPGSLSKALGISIAHNGLLLTGKNIFIADDGFSISENKIATSPRIGVESAGKDALLPYRYYIRGNKYVSGKPK